MTPPAPAGERGGDGGLFPEGWSYSEAGLLFHAAHLFGRDPFRWIDALEPGQRAHAVAFALADLDRRTREAALGLAR